MNNDEWRDIEPKLHAAVGLKINMTSMAIQRTNHVEGWLQQGYDLDRDIIPGIKRFMQKFHGDMIHSWKIFDGEVKNAFNRRQRRKTASSPYTNSKNWDTPDLPPPSLEQRKRSKAMWDKIKAEMNNE